MSCVRVKFLAACSSTGSALPSAAKSKEESLSVQGVCVSNNRADVVHGRYLDLLSNDTGLRVEEIKTSMMECYGCDAGYQLLRPPGLVISQVKIDSKHWVGRTQVSMGKRRIFE